MNRHAVFVGMMHLVLQVPGARSLKDRRQVVRSYRDRVRALGSVSIAEVGDTERIQVAEFGVSVVASESSACREWLDKVRSMADTLPEAVLAEARQEVVSFGRGPGTMAQRRALGVKPKRPRDDSEGEPGHG